MAYAAVRPNSANGGKLKSSKMAGNSKSSEMAGNARSSEMAGNSKVAKWRGTHNVATCWDKKTAGSGGVMKSIDGVLDQRARTESYCMPCLQVVILYAGC